MYRLLAGLLCVLLVIPFGMANVTSTLLAAPSLPPRPPLPPVPENRARILLDAGSAFEGAWTVVQWQGGDGVWHDVEGWRGHVRHGQVRWRVAEKDFGTGPFRWMIYDEAGGAMLAASSSFTLPTAGVETVIVRVMPIIQEATFSP